MILVPRRGYRARIADPPKKPTGGKPKGRPSKKPAAAKPGKAAGGQAKKPAAAKPKPGEPSAARLAAPERKSSGFKVPRLGAVLAGAIVVVLVAWLIFHGGGGSGESAKPGEPSAATAGSLQEMAARLGSPVYWAGPQKDSELEVTESEGGERVYVRYLTGGAEIGDPRPDFLTVGTYAFEDPVRALKRQAKESGGELTTAPGGATVYISRKRPQSVYLAYPGVEVEIEVYDPDPRTARSLVASGQIVPVG
jgi:hypothetical protein